jgi:uncharacterized protein YndB with AHSA1/START domain
MFEGDLWPGCHTCLVSETRSEILQTGDPKTRAARIIINAPAARIFGMLVDPRRHAEFDGTATVRGIIHGPDRLSLGSEFGARMRLGINYRVTNRVVEFEPDALIAWRHVARWRWRYELREISPTQTEVTETFDANTAPVISLAWLRFRDAYPWTQMAVAKSLVRLKALAESEDSDSR